MQLGLITRFVAGTLALVAAGPVLAVNDVGGTLITLTNSSTAPNGAWSWFEDERAIIDDSDPNNTLLLVSSVSAGNAPERGDIDLLWRNLDTGAQGEFELHDQLEQDDHDSAALWRRPDGRYVASYGRHGTDDFTRWRVSTNPGDPTAWEPEQMLDASPASGANATYNNLHYLAADNDGQGRLYNFVRSENFNPNIMVSSDWGDSWSYGGRLLSQGTGGVRPYMRYFSDGDAIHFFATEGHPRDVNNSIYHGYIRDGQLFSSNGGLVDADLFDTTYVGPADLTQVFAANTVVNGNPMTRAWNIDVAIDSAGNPYGVFQARIDPGTLSGGQESLDHQFFYTRFDGNNWNTHPLALAGRDIYNASPNGSEDDYTGLIALDPNDPDTLYMSTPIDPRTDVAMEHYEIFRGQTTDNGATWQWDPITFNSTMDNVRPIMPAWSTTESALLWLRGDYVTFRNWSTEVVLVTDITPLDPSVSIADFNDDDLVDLLDYRVLLNGLHADFTGVTDQQIAYQMGDLNGDFRTNFGDILIFEDEYNRVNGQGSLAIDLAAVPEPSALGLLGVAVLFGASWRYFW